jgi:uncharacterized protein YqjF (DUF2071 family)
VTVGGQPGVWFITLDTSSPLFVAVGRSLYGLAYRRANMIVARHGSRIYYASVHADRSFVASYEPVGPTAPAERGSLEEWLVERYRLFAVRAGDLVSAEVGHTPWLLQTAAATIELNTSRRPGSRSRVRRSCISHGASMPSSARRSEFGDCVIMAGMGSGS